MEPVVLRRRETLQTSILTLNRPKKRNALSLELMQQFHCHFSVLEDEADCRVAIIGGTGPVFCAGLDLAEAADPPSPSRARNWWKESLAP